MVSKKNTRIRFLVGYAPTPEWLGVLAYPVALDEHEVEFTRFVTTNNQRWVQTPFELDIVSLSFRDSAEGKFWWLLGKRGQVIALDAAHSTQEQIDDAGTGPGKLGYVNSMRIISNRIFVCGYRRQIYERIGSRWLHIDAGIVADESISGVSLNDIDGNPTGEMCAVGNDGEIAYRASVSWEMADSPTNAHLHAICVDGIGAFCAAGADGTVIRGDASGFQVLTSGQPVGKLWDIEWYNDELIVSASTGIFKVSGQSLIPYDPPLPSKVVGYKLAVRDGRLWSIGTHQIFCLDGKTWTEWVCPDNKP